MSHLLHQGRDYFECDGRLLTTFDQSLVTRTLPINTFENTEIFLFTNYIMVANLGDKLIIEDPDRYFKDRRTVHWVQGAGLRHTVEFSFIPFYVANNRVDVSYIAVEVSRLDEFRELCREFTDTGGWGTIGVKNYEFTVTSQFKYGQNNARTVRFLVFQNPDYNPFQHNYTDVADVTKEGYVKDHIETPGRVMTVIKAIYGDELHSF